MSISDIIDYQQLVIDKLKAKYQAPMLRDVRSHPGKLTIDDIDRLVTLAPAAFVAILGATPAEKLATGEALVNLNIAVFVATKNGASPNDSADRQGWRIAQSIASWALWNYFDNAQFPAQNVEIENLWSVSEDRKGACIMGVAWTTQAKIGTDLTGQVAVGPLAFPSQNQINGTVNGNSDSLGPVTAQPAP